MRASLVRAVAVAAVLTVATACGTETPYDEPIVVPASPNTVPGTQVCPERNGNAGPPLSVEGLQISAVVICDTGRRSTSAYVEKRYTTGIEQMVAALGKPDQKRPDGEFFCGGAEPIFPQIMVITAGGTPLAPHLPVDACDSPEAVADAIWALSERPPDQTLVIEPANTALEDAQRAKQAAAVDCPVAVDNVLPRILESGARAPLPQIPMTGAHLCLMERDRESDAARLAFMLGGGGGDVPMERLQRGLDGVDLDGSCPIPELGSGVSVFLVDDGPLFYFAIAGECGLVWSADGVVGSLQGDEVLAFA